LLVLILCGSTAAFAASTNSATNVTQTGAQLNATDHLYFKYSDSLSNLATANQTGSKAASISASISGLSPGKTYYFESCSDTGCGPVQTFTTSAASPSPSPGPPPSPSPSPQPPPTGGPRWKPQQRLSWYWQLQGNVDNSKSVAAYDIDGFNNPASEVAALHAQGKKAICYIDVGTWENWRSDAGSFPASVKGSGNGWPGEAWLDIRQQSVLQPILDARFRMCQQKGFDAIEPDNMDGYTNSTGFPLTAAQQLAFNQWVAQDAHALGLAVFQKNDVDQTAQLQPYFDGMIDEQCNEYSECNTTQPYLTAGKPVLNAEYSKSPSSFCAADNAAGIMGAQFSLNLDGTTFNPCQTS
jgi:hypothetical protein